jgi:hypothetical protein
MKPMRFGRISPLGLPAAMFAALLVQLPGVSSLEAQDQFGQLVDRIPRSANAVVILNMEKILGSPLGVQEGWKENLSKAFEAGVMRVPPKATRFVLAEQLDFQYMEPIWEAAVMDAGETITVEQIAEARGGKVDSVSDLPAVALPRDRFVVQFAPNTFGVMAPANRQEVYRWVQEIESDKPLSPYLQGAAVYSDKAGTDIIMAIDLEGVVGVKDVVSYLNAVDLPAEAKKDLASLAQWLAGVRGVRLGVTIGAQPVGKLAVDFRDNAPISAELAKTVFLGILAEGGMSLTDLESWKPAASGREVSLTGYFSKDGLRRVLSVVESPAPHDLGARPTGGAVSPSDAEGIKAAKTLEHFNSVTTLLTDIKKDMSGNLANLASMSLWFDKFARRIEALPTLNVDEEMLEYSAYAARQLRNASGAVRGMGIRSGVRQSQITAGPGTGWTAHAAGGGYRYGRWGGYGGGWGVATYSPYDEARAVGQERRKVRYQERGAMAANVHTIRDEIIQATNDIRRVMTERYQIQF